MGMKSQLKDAQSNKTISIVTMTFLPATAVAAICSMNVFDWQRPDKVYVSPHFWIFWVVAIVLTAAVLSTFLIWKRRLSTHARKRERDDEEEKARKEADSDDDTVIPEEPKHGASGRQKQLNRPIVEEKQAHVSEQEHRDEQGRSSRRRSRRRSNSRRSHTTSRDARGGPGYDRTASGLSFRGESAIV